MVELVDVIRSGLILVRVSVSKVSVFNLRGTFRHV